LAVAKSNSHWPIFQPSDYNAFLCFANQTTSKHLDTLYLRKSMFAGLSGYWQDLNEWFFRTPDRALDEAYKAAQRIRSIEEESFGGQPIPVNDSQKALPSYLRADLQKYLNIAKIRLTEFQTSRSLDARQSDNPNNPYGSDIEAEALVLEKLQFIDWILDRYSGLAKSSSVNSVAAVAPQTIFTNFENLNTPAAKNNKLMDRSVINTFKKLQQDLNPQAEQEVVTTFRSSKDRTRNSLRFLLTLALVPLLVHFVSKFILFGPVIDFYYPHTHKQNIFINTSLEKEAMEELESFERHLKFQALTDQMPKLSTEEIEDKVKEKASVIRSSFTRQSSNAIKNWFADFAAIASFALMISRSKRQVTNLFEFIDSIINGLSDTAKAFMIILFSDMFVGFHSPHGWEVILIGIADHLGITENRNFNSLFIATFPVILDTIFKYWIFRYLSGQSPSSVATYKTMNE
jgi:CemA family